MVIRGLFKLSTNWASNGGLFPSGLKIKLGIVIPIPMDNISLVKEILEPLLTILIGFESAYTGHSWPLICI